MDLSFKDIKRKAKFQLGGNGFNVMILAVIFISIYAVIPFVFRSIGFAFAFFVSGPIVLGLCMFFLSVSRVDKTPNEDAKKGRPVQPMGITDFVYAIKSINNANPYQARLSLAFYGFRHFFKALGLFLWYVILVSLWSILFIVPGIVKAISLGMSFFILADDPSMSLPKAMVLSEQITEGHRKEIFLFGLSFIGWILFTVVTVLIASFVTLPYITTSYAVLYDELKKESINKGVIKEDDIVSSKPWE